MNAWDYLGLSDIMGPPGFPEYEVRANPELARQAKTDFNNSSYAGAKSGSRRGQGNVGHMRDFDQQVAQGYSNTGPYRAINNVHQLPTGGSGQNYPYCYPAFRGGRMFYNIGDQQIQQLNQPKRFNRFSAEYICHQKVWECRRRLVNNFFNLFRGKRADSVQTSATNIGYFCHVCHENGEQEYRFVRKSSGM